MHSHHVCIDYARCRLENNLSQNRQGLYFECLIWPLASDCFSPWSLRTFVCYMHSLDSAQILQSRCLESRQRQKISYDSTERGSITDFLPEQMKLEALCCIFMYTFGTFNSVAETISNTRICI